MTLAFVDAHTLAQVYVCVYIYVYTRYILYVHAYNIIHRFFFKGKKCVFFCLRHEKLVPFRGLRDLYNACHFPMTRAC